MESQSFFDISFAELPNNETIAYRRISNPSKPLLICLHGQLTTSIFFHEISKELIQCFDLIFIDMRGYGRSSYNSPITSLIDLSDDLLLFINKLGIKKFNLLGFSMGGAVALKFASENSGLLEHLILISSAGIRGFPILDQNEKRVTSYEEMKNHAFCKMAGEKLKNHDKQFFEKWSEKWYLNDIEKFHEKRDLRNFFIEEILLQRNLVDTCWASNSFNISNEHNSIIQGNNEIKNVSCPTILIHGKSDKSINYKESEETFERIGSKEKTLEIVEEADHYALVNNAKVIADLIKRYV